MCIGGPPCFSEGLGGLIEDSLLHSPVSPAAMISAESQRPDLPLSYM
jgi:hypothetical protein